MKWAPAAIAGVATLVLASIGFAHDTWLLADAASVAIGEPVGLRLTSGDGFPRDDFAIDPARVTRATVRIGRHPGREGPSRRPTIGRLCCRCDP